VSTAPLIRPDLPGRRRSIRASLSLTLIAVIGLVLAGFAAVVAYLTSDQADADLRADLAAYLALGETALPAPVWNFDTETVDSFVEALRLDEKVVLAAVLSEGQEVARQSDAVLSAVGLSSLAARDDLVAGTVALSHEGIDIGSFTIALSRDSVRTRTLASLFQIAGVTALIIIAIAAVSFWVASRYVARLQKLEGLAARVAGGELDTPVVPERNDELGALSASLEVMRSSIRGFVADLKDANQTLETKVEQRTADLSAANAELKDANRLIVDSIHYASRIQEAVLPSPSVVAAGVEDHFLIWEPRDLVGGDFVWFHSSGAQEIIIVADCTGHGVPGAFMTLISGTLLDRAFAAKQGVNPVGVLTALNTGLKKILGQEDVAADQAVGKELTDDGLEAAVCIIDRQRNTLSFAGARMSLWHRHGSDIAEIKGDKIGLGYRRAPMDATFTMHQVVLDDDTAFYVTTDGLIDQVGGARPMSFGKRRFRAAIMAEGLHDMAAQKAALVRTLSDYQGDQIRRDDVTVLGFLPKCGAEAGG